MRPFTRPTPAPVPRKASASALRPYPRPDDASAPVSVRPTAAGTAARAAVLADELQRRAARRSLSETTAFLDFAAAQATGEVDRQARSLEHRIRAHLERGALEVRLTDNRYSMISVRRAAGPRYHVRLHHMFADADPVVTRALARYIGDNDEAASRLLGEYIEKQQHTVRPARRPSVHTLETRGRFIDLQEVYDDLNRRYFGGAIDARITWGQKLGKPRRRNSIKMGSYAVEDRLIRMHRSLDRAFVPRFFVEWIVFHEMLHQVHEACEVGGRRRFHTRAFLADEACFEHYQVARTWERANLDAILTY